MRYCPHCHRLNPGRPMHCHYCARTWQVRLCPSRHENPPEAQFCGICGSADLSETAGPIPLWVWLIRVLVLLVLIILLSSLNVPEFRWSEQHTALVIATSMLLIVLKMALSVLPGTIRNMFQNLMIIPQRAFMQVLAWFWERIRNVFR